MVSLHKPFLVVIRYEVTLPAMLRSGLPSAHRSLHTRSGIQPRPKDTLGRNGGGELVAMVAGSGPVSTSSRPITGAGSCGNTTTSGDDSTTDETFLAGVGAASGE